MVRDDLIGGLKIALSRGESLQRAMQSFFNAGYKKEEIEEAARTLKQEGFNPLIVQPQKAQQQPIKTGPSPQQSAGLQARMPEFQAASQYPRQTISSYGEEKKGTDFITILLIIILVLLLGILVSVFLFKQELIEFLNKLFG